MVLFFLLSKIPLTQQMTFHLKGTKVLDELRHQTKSAHYEEYFRIYNEP